MSFAFERTPGQWTRCTENRMSAFCEFHQHFVRDMIPNSLWIILFPRIPLLFRTCEGGVDVVGVITPLVLGGGQVVLHGDQVVELSVLLGMHEKGEVEEDGEDQVEVEREEGEVKEKRSCMTMNVDEMRLKNTLSHEVHVTQTSKGETKTTRSQCKCSQVVQLARVGVRDVLVVDVVCVMLVLIARVVVQAVSTQFS